MVARISLVFPLPEERGMTITALSACIGQPFPRERFEILVVADDRLAIDPEIDALLRKQDRVVRGRFANLAEQFDAGMRAASGDFVFLTESHCLPAPDCLEAMDRYLVANPRLAGACCESVPAWHNNYQFIDATTFEEGYRLFLRTDDWRKLSVHGMALRRDVYLALGGLQDQYGRFAEMLFAAALRDGGHELGYARESIVTHHYRETLQEIIDGTDEYVSSECGYRLANPGPDRVGHTYLPTMTNPYSPGAARHQREVCATLIGGILGGNTPLVRTALHEAARAVMRLLGRRGPVASAWLAVAACRVRCWLNRRDAKRVDVPYRELVRLASILSCVRSLAKQPAVDVPLPRQSTRIGSIRCEWACYGFHGVERFDGASFQWSGRLSAVRLPLLKGKYRLGLVTRGLRGEEVALRVAFNGTRIPPVARPDGVYEIPVERWHCHEREQTLILHCKPLCPWKSGVKDYRELGLPLFRIEAEPAMRTGEKRSRLAA